MQRNRTVGGDRADAGQRPAGQHQHVRIGANRPFGKHDEDENGRGTNRAGGGRRTPCDEQCAGHQNCEHDDGSIGMETCEHDHRGAQEIGRERTGRDRLDLAFVGRRAEQESTDHQQCGEHDPRDHVERVRSNHRRAALQAGECPQQRECDGGDREPAPQPDARQAKGCRGDDGEIDVERPEVRFFRGHQHGGDEGGGDAEARQRRSVQQRRGERAERHQSQQKEGGCGYEKTIQRVSGVDGRESNRGPGGGENRRDIGDR